jgi:hypothetical protein
LGIFYSPHAHLNKKKKKKNEEGKRGSMVLRVGGENGETRKEEKNKGRKVRRKQ